MTVYLVPGVFGAGGQFIDQNGKTMSGAQINIYAAGTVSKVSTWTTSAQTITTSNPIITDASGRLPYEIWQTERTAIKIILTDSLLNTIGTYDNLYGIGDPYAISGVALLANNNLWTGQNTFTNVSVNVLQVTSIFISSETLTSLTVSTLNASTINTSALTLSSLGVSALAVSSLTLSTLTVSNLTVSGTALLFGKQIARTVTGVIGAQNLGVGAESSSVIAHGLGTDQVHMLISVTSSINSNYMAYGARTDKFIMITRGLINNNTANSPTISSVVGSVTIGVFNNHTATQTVTVVYSIIA